MPRAPIQLFRAIAPGTWPSAGQLLEGELAINITDGVLFYADQAGVVRAVRLIDGNWKPLRADLDQFADWTAAERGQALRNLRRMPTFLSGPTNTVTVDDMGRLLIYESTANANFVLPSLATAKDGFYFELETLNLTNRGGIVTLTPIGADRIEGVNAPFAIPTGQSVKVLAYGGANYGWRVLGLNRAPQLYNTVLAADTAPVILWLPPGYRRYILRGDNLIMSAATAGNLILTVSRDNVAFATSYNFTYMVAAVAPTGVTTAGNSNANLIPSVTSTTDPTSFNLELTPGSANVRPKWHGHGARGAGNAQAATFGGITADASGSYGPGFYGPISVVRLDHSSGTSLFKAGAAFSVQGLL